MTEKTLDNIAKLADAIALAALNKPIETQIDAFKALHPYYAAILKARGKSDDDEPDGPTFDDLGAGFNGGTEIHRRRGRRSSEPAESEE
jgi:hypothetical protein